MKANIEPIPPITLSGYLSGLFYNGNNFKNIILTSRGRDAIQLAMSLFNLKKNDTILVPALTCDTVSGALTGNCRLIYYDLKTDYSIDLNILENIIRDQSVKVLYLIHYFGFIHNNIDLISDLCKRYKVLLIEDHAHSALSKYNQEFGDVHIFSFRKLLPTADGGGVLISGDSHDYNFYFNDRFKANLKGIIIALKRILSLKSKNIRKYTGRLIQADIDQMNQEGKKLSPLPASRFAKGIIKSSDLRLISGARRKLYLRWLDLFVNTPFTPVFPELNERTVPYGFPIKLQNAREMLHHFEQYNIFLKIHWYPLPPNTSEKCPTSHQLANQSITLPIYPNLKEEYMEFIKDELTQHGLPLSKI